MNKGSAIPVDFWQNMCLSSTFQECLDLIAPSGSNAFQYPDSEGLFVKSCLFLTTVALLDSKVIPCDCLPTWSKLKGHSSLKCLQL